MYSYITSELPKAVFDNFKEVDGERVSIFGHSMGGHGALSLVCRTTTRSGKGKTLMQKVSVFEESWEIQVGFCIRAHCQPKQMSMG